jgi:hypothetical protein
MYRPNPLGPPRQPMGDYPSVRFAIRAWVIGQCMSAAGAGIALLAFLVIGLKAVATTQPPAERPLPAPSQLTLEQQEEVNKIRAERWYHLMARQEFLKHPPGGRAGQ